MRGAAFFAYADNYLIDVKFGIIMDVEASRAIRQAEVGASRTMIKRTRSLLRHQACAGWRPTPPMRPYANLDWLVNEQGIAPHVPVIDKSQREDGTFSREDFVFDQVRDTYKRRPAGARPLATTGHVGADHTLRYIGSVPIGVPRLPACARVLPKRASATDQTRCE